MDYRNGINQTWKFNGGTGSGISRYMQAEIEKAKRERKAEQFQRHSAAAKRAAYIWSFSPPITEQSEHAYLINRRIQPHGVRLYRDALVIPLFDKPANMMVSLQFISPEGEKRFLTDGRKRGCFSLIGKSSDRLLICEGFATAASLHENARQRVVIAFDAGNLLPVARNIRELVPDTEIIICGDNDVSGVGQTRAREAALAIGGKVLIPATPGADWNDVLTGGRHHA